MATIMTPTTTRRRPAIDHPLMDLVKRKARQKGYDDFEDPQAKSYVTRSYNKALLGDLTAVHSEPLKVKAQRINSIFEAVGFPYRAAVVKGVLDFEDLTGEWIYDGDLAKKWPYKQAPFKKVVSALWDKDASVKAWVESILAKAPERKTADEPPVSKPLPSKSNAKTTAAEAPKAKVTTEGSYNPTPFEGKKVSFTTGSSRWTVTSRELTGSRIKSTKGAVTAWKRSPSDRGMALVAAAHYAKSSGKEVFVVPITKYMVAMFAIVDSKSLASVSHNQIFIARDSAEIFSVQPGGEVTRVFLEREDLKKAKKEKANASPATKTETHSEAKSTFESDKPGNSDNVHIDKMKAIAKRWGLTQAQERARDFMASLVLGRDFGEDAESFIARSSASVRAFVAWYRAGMPGLDQVAKAEKSVKEDPKVEEPKPKQERAAPEKIMAPAANIVMLPIGKIKTDPERFQPRDDFSDEKVTQIVDQYDPAKFDAITVWKDVGDHYYVLAGHHRYEAARRLGLSSVPSKILSGSEQEAITYAWTSNNLGRQQSAAENAKYLRRLMDEGRNASAIKKECQQLYDKSCRTVWLLSQLDPKGLALSMLAEFSRGSDGYNDAETMAKWVGALRDELGVAMSRQHENEIYQWLRENYKTQGRRLRSESEFSSYMTRQWSLRFPLGAAYNAGESLNLNNAKESFFREHDERVREAERALDEAKRERDRKLADVVARGIDNETRSRIMRPYDDAVVIAQRELLEVKDSIDKVAEAARSQESLFGLGDIVSAEGMTFDVRKGQEDQWRVSYVRDDGYRFPLSPSAKKPGKREMMRYVREVSQEGYNKQLAIFEASGQISDKDNDDAKKEEPEFLPATEKPQSKEFQALARRVQDNQRFQDWFGDSKVTDGDGLPLVVFHGARRGDRINEVFDPRKATSGPMPFFTDNTEVASGYATGKADTSLHYSGDVDSFYRQWKIRIGKKFYPINQAWYYLSSEQKETMRERIYKIGHEDQDDYSRPIVYGVHPNMGKDTIDWYMKGARGNVLELAVELWLMSGQLCCGYEEEHRFVEVLNALGIKSSDIDHEHQGRQHNVIFPVFLSIQNPLRTDKVSVDLVERLEKAIKNKRAKAGEGADLWDKRHISGKDWIHYLRYGADETDGYLNTNNSSAWTRIPDWVTAFLKEEGYDGIIDVGGKMGGDKHGVYIPFTSTQVKSATGNKGTFNPEKKSILADDMRQEVSRELPQEDHNVQREQQENGLRPGRAESAEPVEVAPVTTDEIMNMEPPEMLPLTGSTATFLTSLMANFNMLIWGGAGSGKSSFVVKFACDLAETGTGMVLYYMSEEKVRSGRLKARMDLMRAYSRNINFDDAGTFDRLVALVNTGMYRFVVIDSINMMNVSQEQLIDLMKAFPEVSWIFIAQANKGKNAYAGVAKLDHAVDTVIHTVSKDGHSWAELKKHRDGPLNRHTIFEDQSKGVRTGEWTPSWKQ